MENILLFVHILGVVCLVGGLFAQIQNKQKALSPMMLYGAWILFASGLVQVAIKEPDVNHPKIGIKLLLLIIILSQIYYAKKSGLSTRLFWIMVSLGVTTMAVAFLWQ